MTLTRSGWLHSDPAKTKAWQERSRRPLPERSERKVAELADPGRAKVRAFVYARDGGTDRDGYGWVACRLRSMSFHRQCYGQLTVHHIHKEGQGGPFTWENLVSLCLGANNWVEYEPDIATNLGLVLRTGMTWAECWARMRAAGLVDYGPDGR